MLKEWCLDGNDVESLGIDSDYDTVPGGGAFWLCFDYDGFLFKKEHSHILLSLKREIESQLEAWYPGCVFPVPEEEVDADVMREWAEMQERI